MHCALLQFLFLQKNAAETTNQDQLFAQKLTQQTNVVATQISQDQLFALQKQKLTRQINAVAMQTNQKLLQKAVTTVAANHVVVAADDK